MAAGKGATEPCEGELTQAFLQFGDDDLFRPVAGGDFEGDMSDWRLSDGASVVEGASPLGGSKVLSLEPGSSAVTPVNCMDGSELFSRMLARSADDSSGAGRVLVDVIDPRTGRDHSVGIVRGDEDWELTRRFLVPFWWIRGGSTEFKYRFTAVGRSATLLDSVFVDPRHKH